MAFNVLKEIERTKEKLGLENPQAHELFIHDRCCCNKCPLHPDYERLENDPSDPMKKCILPKRIRKAIGTYFGLKNRGLTSRELKAEKRWAELPQEVKDQRIKEITQKGLFYRLSRKGYAVTRKKPSTSKFTLTKGVSSPSASVRTGTSEQPEGSGEVQND